MVSIDGAAQKTYETLQRGAKFHILQEKLKIVSQLRKSGQIDIFSAAMVIQKANVYEILDEISWIETFGSDEFLLQKIRNYGNYDAEYFFENISLYDRELREPKPQYKAIIEQALQWKGNMKISII
jgi:hypothetical protein